MKDAAKVPKPAQRKQPLSIPSTPALSRTPIPSAASAVEEEAVVPLSECVSSPITCGPRLTVEEFVSKYSLLPEAVTYLKNLQFVPENSTRDVEREDWKEAGFKIVLWKQVQKANKAYCAELGLDA